MNVALTFVCKFMYEQIHNCKYVYIYKNEKGLVTTLPCSHGPPTRAAVPVCKEILLPTLDRFHIYVFL